ncbi:hypothetical protein EPR50_G00082560 [Perca flavescens]|uniref:TERF1-interacting nuclear factor 2 N-terminal domain-containing protein n=1 Tax=Perca flavescens TaxID=8167 RepID=A0A484D1F0_PERFV|nr:uncharacterized protein LOC114560359 [Perca flavescens]TDH09051.1 hypothetical protein EPR50_G00082560 [Perca flavescens]
MSGPIAGAFPGGLRYTEHLMEGVELQPAADKCLEDFPKFPLWIIEYVWAHQMIDIQEVVDPSNWPDVDSQPLSLEDSWRLRVASARVYSTVKTRDMEHFERVMGFLEATYTLLPRLVAPIKHMKIMFGLKTMFIMWMLREGRGMVDTVFKISKFFPSKLPQYQDQCSQHEMFLMRKNHVDFKALAQALAMDKDKLEDYIKNQMEEQYGEHYAQKVEDRLLHYLHQLETVLPGDTYIDKILKQENPATEEEKLLLEVITSDSTNIATTLKKLLHCDVASCHPGRISQSSANGTNGMESSQLSKSARHVSSSKALLKSLEAKTLPQLQPEVFRGGEAADQVVSKDNPLLLKDDNVSGVSKHQQTEEDGEVVKRMDEDAIDKEKEEISQRSNEGGQEASSSPQFCSKHQRWVKSILQECPDECSEELLLQANVSSSPPLFHSSSSTTSSQDLTPSDLIPCPSDQQHPSSQTSSQASKQANPEDEQKPGSASDASQTKLLPQPSSSRDTQLPILLSPVVRLIDIASVGRIYPNFKPHQVAPNHCTMSSNERADSASCPWVLTSPCRYVSKNNTIPRGTMKDFTFDQSDTVAPTNPLNKTYKVQTAPSSHDASTSASCQPPTQRLFSKLSRKFRRARTTTRHSQALDGFSQNPLAEQFKKAPTTFRMTSPLRDFNVSGFPEGFTYTAQSGTLSSVPLSPELSRQVVPQNSVKPHAHTLNITPFQSKTLPCSTVVSSTSNSNCPTVSSETSRVLRAQLRLSLPSQAVLLQSKLLQPYVTLHRLSTQECYRVTKRRSSTRNVDPVVQVSNDEDRREDEEEDADSSFDLNTLYSSHSSSSDIEDSLDCDPDYKPCFNKKRLLLEYETARILNHI